MKEIFCKIYTQFYGEPISEPKQVTDYKMTGDELKQFSEFYFQERLSNSGLQHFFLGKKYQHILLGFIIGFILSGLFTFLIFF